MAIGARHNAILNAAEQLFADRRYDGVSMRDVAKGAGVGLGLVTYHFPSKESLFSAVVGRRAVLLNEARYAALAALRSPSLETLVATFFEPYRRFIGSGDQGWRAYAKLHAFLSQDATWTSMVAEHFGAIAHLIIDQIVEVEPRLSREAAVRGYTLMLSSTVSVFSENGLLDLLSEGEASSRDVEANFSALVAFSSAGIRAMIGQSPARVPASIVSQPEVVPEETRSRTGPG